jgi:hypothetical protein
VTVTPKIRSASTSPSEGELARRFLGDDFVQRLNAVTALPFDVRDRSTNLDVWTSYLNEYRKFVVVLVAFDDPFHLAQTLAGSTKTESVRQAARGARPVYRTVLADNHATDPTLITSILDGLLGKPRTDPLEGYEQYSHGNWDGYDAEPITAETLQYARRLLRPMPQTFGPPDIAPSADGSIGLEWVPEHGPLRKLFLDIGPGEEWRAYWNRRDGEFGRLQGTRLSAITKRTLQALFKDLSS